jgi:hypothetical protein
MPNQSGHCPKDAKWEQKGFTTPTNCCQIICYLGMLGSILFTGFVPFNLLHPSVPLC